MSPHLAGCERGKYLATVPVADIFLAVFLRMGPRCTCGAAARLQEATS